MNRKYLLKWYILWYFSCSHGMEISLIQIKSLRLISVGGGGGYFKNKPLSGKSKPSSASHLSLANRTVSNMDSYRRQYPIHSDTIISTFSSGSVISSILPIGVHLYVWLYNFMEVWPPLSYLSEYIFTCDCIISWKCDLLYLTYRSTSLRVTV